MKTFLEKLERQAGRWLNALDSQLQQPIVQVMTGAVFTHDTSSNGHTSQAQTTPLPIDNPAHEAGKTDNEGVVGLPKLWKANAFAKH